MDFTAWMRQWLAQHPLRLPEPDAQARARFTHTVMQRVKTPAPAAAPAWRAAWQALRRPQFAFGMAAAALLVAALAGRGPSIEQRALLVAALNDPTSDVLPAIDHQVLVEEWLAHDTLVLAEATATADEQWLEQTLQLLEQFDEDVSSEGDATDEEWLQDLQLIDDTELSVSS